MICAPTTICVSIVFVAAICRRRFQFARVIDLPFILHGVWFLLLAAMNGPTAWLGLFWA